MSYTDKLCLYQSLSAFVYTSHVIVFVYTSQIDFVYKVHQRPRGGERLAGRYNAVERFLRLLRLSRFVVHARFVGTSREGWRSARRRAAGTGRRLRPLYRCQDVGFELEGGRRSLAWSWSPSCSLPRVLVGEGGPVSKLFAIEE